MLTESSSVSWIASRHDRSKIRLPGTSRAQPPAATLEMASRAAPKAGVTRVADLTRLDTIGIPTFQATRPMARTLAVSMGKGVTAELAKLSALMEAIETWHLEQPMAPTVTAAPRDISHRLSYVVSDLALCAPSLLHDGLPLDWVVARSLADGVPTLVPVNTVRLSLELNTEWNPPAFLESANGLASGNTLLEATLHALYEVIERDAMTAAVASGHRGVPVDPRTLESVVADELCTMIERAGAFLEVRFVPSPTGLPCFLAWMACDDYPAAMYGFGCHLSPEIALTRAITEAAQTRLGYISGARDDLETDIGDMGASRRPAPSGPAADLRDLICVPVARDSLLDDLEYVVKQATVAFSSPPLVVDLTRDEIGVPVVKVVAPGSRVCPEVL
jgi:ribosomal protein S12 methylthiotransferase accessory factor